MLVVAKRNGKPVRIILCEGSRFQNGRLTILLISLPADSTTVSLNANIKKRAHNHSHEKDYSQCHALPVEKQAQT